MGYELVKRQRVNNKVATTWHKLHDKVNGLTDVWLIYVDDKPFKRSHQESEAMAWFDYAIQRMSL